MAGTRQARGSGQLGRLGTATDDVDVGYLTGLQQAAARVCNQRLLRLHF